MIKPCPCNDTPEEVLTQILKYLITSHERAKKTRFPKRKKNTYFTLLCDLYLGGNKDYDHTKQYCYGED